MVLGGPMRVGAKTPGLWGVGAPRESGGELELGAGGTGAG